MNASQRCAVLNRALLLAGCRLRTLGYLAVKQGCQHRQHISLNQGVEQSEQNAHQNRQHIAELNIVVNQLRYQQAAELSAKQTEAHGDGQRKLF